MIDTSQQLYDYLSTGGTTLNTLVSTRIWQGQLLDDFTNTSAALVFQIDSETSHASNATHRATISFRCYGGSDDPVDAMTVYRALHDVLHGKGSNTDQILRGYQISASGVLSDPDEGWPYMVTTYQVIFSEA